VIRPRRTTAQAQLDLRDYHRHMLSGRADLCLEIECMHGLDGYPPEIVSVGLSAAAHGQDVDAAIENHLAGVSA
jgi:hypothetical protein